MTSTTLDSALDIFRETYEEVFGELNYERGDNWITLYLNAINEFVDEKFFYADNQAMEVLNDWAINRGVGIHMDTNDITWNYDTLTTEITYTIADISE